MQRRVLKDMTSFEHMELPILPSKATFPMFLGKPSNVLSYNTSLNPVPNAQELITKLTIHITITNYISKTSLYTTFHMYLLGPWLLKILMFALLVTHEIAT
jgi:hypothetical protein